MKMYKFLSIKISLKFVLKGPINSSPSAAYASMNRASIGSDNNLSPIWRQAIIYTNAGLLSIGPLRTNFSEILIKIQ